MRPCMFATDSWSRCATSTSATASARCLRGPPCATSRSRRCAGCRLPDASRSKERRAVDGTNRNGHVDADVDAEAEGDVPLTAAEEAAGALEALAATDESLDERVEAVIGELDGVERLRDGESVTYLVGGRPFA